ncbi:MotE family protein [Marinivivus vitaminiproducens]|uniref:MotE family protein n=1 Tax=Marinivivus vitaminiproducens TaxID=3035935 RepID=UPI00279DC2F7|nr:hypothetical protein P4R82_19375 [Geminicoccaceae bacterium SCSIO 64248]
MAIACGGFVLAAALRLADLHGQLEPSEPGPTAASAVLVPADPFAIEPAAGPTAEATPASADAPAAAAPSDRLLAEVARRQAELDVWQATLAERERTVELDEKEVVGLLAELRREREGLQAGMAAVRDEATAEIKRLVAIYEGMKPKDAARILEAMPADAAAAILRPMREARSAPILARMAADRAFAVTVQLAGRQERLRTSAAATP